MCTKCDSPETMQHILFNCDTNQSNLIWSIAKEVCTCKNIPWLISLDITTIMALPLLKVHSPEGNIQNGATHLFLIVMSECAFLIWKLRCKRILDVTPEEPEKIRLPQEAHNQMLATINNRLDQDKILTSRKRQRYRTKGLPEHLMLSTWAGTLSNKSSIPENWICASGVL